ncbi:hypothetical protein ACTL32_04430 [Planococcus sp. FY231025]|uniref:hypothetical protein n=1 Tax=Planococcus sp. FY231025 TaxID=3455699 RepID=UPI003F926F80
MVVDDDNHGCTSFFYSSGVSIIPALKSEENYYCGAAEEMLQWTFFGGKEDGASIFRLLQVKTICRKYFSFAASKNQFTASIFHLPQVNRSLQ